MSDLPPGWVDTTLGEVLAVEDRAITDGPFGSKLASRHYAPSGARVIRLQNIGDCMFNDERAYISLDYFEELRAHEVRCGDLVIASLGQDLPRACIIPALGEPAIVKADCIRARIHPEVDTKWVLYALSAPQTRQRAASRVRGVGRPRLGLGEMRKLSIPLPPLSEQRRIVAALEGHLSRLSAAQRYIDHASSATVTMRTSLRAREIVGNREDVVLGGPLNSEWAWGRLGDLLTRIEAGKSFTCEPRQAGYDEWGVIKVSAMTWGEFREEENKAVPGDRKIDPRHEIHPGDVLVSRANTEDYVGAPVLVRSCRRGLLLSDKSLRLVPKPWVNEEWLVQLLASPLVRRQISMTATGNQDSMRNISQRDLRMIQVPIAPEEDQARIADSLHQQLDDIDHQSIQVDRVKARAAVLRRSLLADAFAGTLVPQDPAEESAEVLLDRIRAQRAAQMPARRRRGTAKPARQEEMLI